MALAQEGQGYTERTAVTHRFLKIMENARGRWPASFHNWESRGSLTAPPPGVRADFLLAATVYKHPGYAPTTLHIAHLDESGHFRMDLAWENHVVEGRGYQSEGLEYSFRAIELSRQHTDINEAAEDRGTPGDSPRFLRRDGIKADLEVINSYLEAAPLKPRTVQVVGRTAVRLARPFKKSRYPQLPDESSGILLP